MKNKIVKIILMIALCLIVMGGAYFGTFLMDKAKRGGEVNVTVTFDDTKSYIIPNVKKMGKEDALKEWPYIITVENSGDAKGLYQIIITDMEDSTIKRDSLSYVLLLDDKEISEGKLKDIKNNVLYTYEIEGNVTQKYKLYIWVHDDVKEEDKYEYKLEFNTIKTGGPGF